MVIEQVNVDPEVAARAVCDFTWPKLGPAVV